MAISDVPINKVFKHHIDLDQEKAAHAAYHLVLAKGDPSSFAVTSDGPTGYRLWLSAASMARLLDALNDKESVSG